MAATKKALSAGSMRDQTYNGTHGNLSVAHGKTTIPAGTLATSTVDLFELSIGVQLVKAKLNMNSGKAKLQIVPKGKAGIDIVDEVDGSSSQSQGDSDTLFWFPEELYDVPCKIVLVTTSDVNDGVQASSLPIARYEIMTTSTGF